jgi:hypothetical protein
MCKMWGILECEHTQYLDGNVAMVALYLESCSHLIGCSWVESRHILRPLSSPNMFLFVTLFVS